MPKTKTEPAAPPEAPKPEERKPTATELRQAEAKRQFHALRDFAEVVFNDMNVHNFGFLKTFKLILDRDGGSTTPIESFIRSLVMMYGVRDDEGKGLTLEDIQFELQENITGDRAFDRAIEEAHFLASRYPLPENNTEEHV